MTVIATAVRHLIAAGVTGNALVTAIEEMEIAISQQQPIKVRSANAVRQERYRERHKALQSVTCNASNVTPPNDIYSNPPELSPSEAKASLAPKGKARKGTRLPDDWQPEALTGEIATAVCAWQPGMLERELARFRDYWTAKSGRTAAKQDWQAAWRNWLRNAEKWTHNGTANRKNTAPRQAGRSPDGFMSALREVADRKPDVSGFEPAGSFSVARLGAC